MRYPPSRTEAEGILAHRLLSNESYQALKEAYLAIERYGWTGHQELPEAVVKRWEDEGKIEEMKATVARYYTHSRFIRFFIRLWTPIRKDQALLLYGEVKRRLDSLIFVRPNVVELRSKLLKPADIHQLKAWLSDAFSYAPAWNQEGANPVSFWSRLRSPLRVVKNVLRELVEAAEARTTALPSFRVNP